MERPASIVGIGPCLVASSTSATVKSPPISLPCRPYRLILPPDLGKFFVVTGGTFGGKEIESLRGEILAFALAPDVAPNEIYCHPGHVNDVLTLNVTNIDGGAHHIFRAAFFLRLM